MIIAIQKMPQLNIVLGFNVVITTVVILFVHYFICYHIFFFPYNVYIKLQNLWVWFQEACNVHYWETFLRYGENEQILLMHLRMWLDMVDTLLYADTGSRMCDHINQPLYAPMDISLMTLDIQLELSID